MDKEDDYLSVDGTFDILPQHRQPFVAESTTTTATARTLNPKGSPSRNLSFKRPFFAETFIQDF